MINFNKKKNKNTNGFTLVETLVALFVFSVSVLSVMLALTRGISGTIYAKDKMVAEYLSQEGIEYFRNMRDTSQFYTDDKNAGWGEFVGNLTSRCTTNNGCYFDNNENSFDFKKISACSSKCPKFLYDAQTGKYNYNEGSPSTFSRKMSIIEIDNDNIKIISKVTYSTGLSEGSVSLSENLSNWIE